MLEIIAVLCLPGAIALLFILSVIDLRERLLPNKFVLAFAVLGVIFHACTSFHYVSIVEMGLGALIGGGILYLIRFFAIRFYGEDALGLGDVKLLTAAGLWLGPYFILIALTLGALLGILHGLGLALYSWRSSKVWPELHNLSLPAGPGFALGIVLTSVYKFSSIPELLM